MATISHITLPDNTDYSIQATGIFFGQVDSTSTSTVYTATIPGVTEYYDGLTILLKNGIVTSAAGFTVNVNNLGAKPVYSNMAAATAETTIFNANYTLLFIYDSTRVEGGCWINYRGYYSDSNSIGYQLGTNSTVLKTADASRYYRLFFTSADGTHWVPANTAKDNSATSKKTVNQRAIDPHGRIIYYGASTNLSAESDVSAAYCWDQYAFALGYSFNRTGAALTLTAKAPVYIKCAPQVNGSAIIDSTTPYVQALPSTEDGKIYIFLGIAYSATNVELVQNHPVYYYKDGAIRLWINAPTASVPTASDTNPQMDGTAAAGTSNNYSRADHVHPTDTSRMAANLKGTANGVAELDANGKVPSSQLPSYVDDVIEGKLISSTRFDQFIYDSDDQEWVDVGQVTPETGKIYVDRFTEKTYRWSGSAFVEISASLALGETSSTAYRGDRGKTAYDHSQLTSGNPHNVSKSDIGLGNVDNVQQYSASNPPPYPVTSVNGSTGAVTLTIPTKVSDLTNDTGFITGMYIASYGSSTFSEVEEAYTSSKIVYCKASSKANPATGLQGRMAFLAYVNINSNNNTVNEFEFQYYRSVSTHTDAQQGDQVFIYKLNRTTGWSVTTREASSKVAANNGLTTSYSSGTITISHANSAITAQSIQAVYPITIDSYGHITGYGSAVTIPEIPSVTTSDNGKILTVVNGAWAAAELPTYQGGVS